MAEIISDATALEVVEEYANVRLRKKELKDGTFLAIRNANVVRDEHFRPDPRFQEPGKPLPAVRAPGEGVSCLERLAALAAA